MFHINKRGDYMNRKTQRIVSIVIVSVLVAAMVLGLVVSAF